MNELFVIIGSKKESTAGLVFVVIKQGLGQFDEKRQVAIAPSGLQQFQAAVEQEGIVVNIGVEVGTTIIIRSEQALIFL